VKLADILHENNVQGIFVGYPLRSVKTLKRMLEEAKGFENLIFVDNEMSFRKAVENDGYQTYFSDRACGDFGHCTPLGYRLMAQNIADAILMFVQMQ